MEDVAISLTKIPDSTVLLVFLICTGFLPHEALRTSGLYPVATQSVCHTGGVCYSG